MNRNKTSFLRKINKHKKLQFRAAGQITTINSFYVGNTRKGNASKIMITGKINALVMNPGKFNRAKNKLFYIR